MDKCRDKPYRETRAEHNPKGQLSPKAKKSYQKEQNARNDSPQSSFAVICQQVEIIRMVPIHPEDKEYEAGKWHNRNQAGQRRTLGPFHYQVADGKDTYTTG